MKFSKITIRTFLLWILVCFSSVVFADNKYLNLGAGFTNSGQYRLGGGFELSDMFGVEANWEHTNKFIKEKVELQSDIFSISLTNSYSDLGVKGLELRANLGIGVMLSTNKSNNDQNYELVNNNFSVLFIPEVQLNYQVTSSFDVYMGYRGVVGKDKNASNSLDTSGVILGVRLYWDRHAPTITILNDDKIDNAIKALRNESASNTQGVSSILDSYGLTPKNSEFFLLDSSENTYNSVSVYIDNKVIEMPLNDNYATSPIRFPKGSYNVLIKLNGVRKNGTKISMETQSRVEVYRPQALSFSLSVKGTLVGDVLNAKIK